jgi:hypothetical protein
MSHDEEEQDETMTCGLGVAERELLRAKLASLPDTVPRRAVWQRIEAQARAEGLLRSRMAGPAARWLAGTGLAAAVALGVLNLDAVTPRTGEGDVAGTYPTEPPYTASGQEVRLKALHALMVESRQLEEDLRALPEQPQLVRAGTAATIASVEDQIAAIDYQLNHSPGTLTDEEVELYWRERVRLMNLLVQLRTAQAQRHAF